MEKIAKEKKALIKKDRDELLKLIISKDGTSYRRFLDIAKRAYVASHLDLVTPEEKAQFKHLILE
jgi:hypothetical protein